MSQHAAMLAAGPPLDCSPVVLAREQPFRIGKAEFRPATREVSFAGKAEIIEPRVMQLLVALRRAGGGLVSKVDLADLVWEGRIVGDDAIHRVVSRLRSVAEKHAHSEFQIETVKKVGYRLVLGGGKDVDAKDRNQLRFGRRELMIGAGAVALASVVSIRCAGILSPSANGAWSLLAWTNGTHPVCLRSRSTAHPNVRFPPKADAN